MWICSPTKVITSPHGLACNQILNHGIKNEKEEARGDFGDKYDTLASNVFSKIFGDTMDNRYLMKMEIGRF